MESPAAWALIVAPLLIVSCGKTEPVAKASPPPSKPVAPTPTPASAKPKFVKPKVIRGVYVNAWAAGSSKALKRLLDLASKTEINAFVIDVRDEGKLFWKTSIVEANAPGATEVAIAKPKALMEELSKRGVYPIARIACFRDRFVPKAHPDRGVQDGHGAPWKDRGGFMWLDPYSKANWDYISKVVTFALDMGFPEIQLDYVRFPSEGKSSTQVFPNKSKYPDKNAKPEDVIASFAKSIADQVHARGATISADVFGIISSSKRDQGIGQALEKVAAPFDVISPMIYPSHFAKGEYGIPDPDQSPAAIIRRSLADYAKRLPNKAIRPWLQDFSLRNPYGAPQVRAQIDSAGQVGYPSFLLWNAASRYTVAALKAKS